MLVEAFPTAGSAGLPQVQKHFICFPELVVGPLRLRHMQHGAVQQGPACIACTFRSKLVSGSPATAVPVAPAGVQRTTYRAGCKKSAESTSCLRRATVEFFARKHAELAGLANTPAVESAASSNLYAEKLLLADGALLSRVYARSTPQIAKATKTPFNCQFAPNLHPAR